MAASPITISGKVFKRPSVYLTGVRLSFGQQAATSVSGGNFSLKLSPGAYTVVCVTSEGYRCGPTTIILRQDFSNLRVLLDLNTLQVTIDPGAPVQPPICAWNEPVILLPMSLQIKKVLAGRKTTAKFELQEIDPQATPSGLFRPYKETFGSVNHMHVNNEYWIRWYPDEMHFINAVGKITESEKEAWKIFMLAYDQVLYDYREANSIDAFISSPENTAAELSALGLADPLVRNGIITEWLKVYYGFSSGLLADDKLTFCKRYDEYVVPKINSGELGLREVFGWRDMETPQLKTAWLNLVKDVGIERAGQLVRYIQHGKSWDFDTAYPLYTSRDLIDTLQARHLSDDLRAILEHFAHFTFSEEWVIENYRDGWTVADPPANLKFVIWNEADHLAIYNESGEEVEPLELMMDRGAPLLSLPESVSIYTVRNNAIALLQPDIKINRQKILVGPTELEGTHWTTDFELAVLNGMGIKITDPAKVALIDTADWLIVTGINRSSDSRTVLEELIRRNDAQNEFSLIAQDSPTNNTEQAKTAHADLGADAEKLLTERRLDSPEPFNENYLLQLSRNSPDLARLQHLFKFAPDALSGLSGGNLAEQSEAMALSTVIWQALSTSVNMYFTAFSTIHGQEDTVTQVNRLKKFFVGHVRGRGTYPVVKLGSNPYGIIPVLPTEQYNLSALDSQADRKTKLIALLSGLKTVFFQLSQERGLQVREGSPNAYEDLLAILRQPAVSQRLEFTTSKADASLWRLFFNAEPMKAGCASVKEKVASSNGTPYPFHPETKYLDDFYKGNFASITIANDSPVLKRIMAYVAKQLATKDQQMEFRFSLDVLRRIHPDKLEVLLLETLDLFSHRLDAWLTGVADLQLSKVLRTTTKPPPVGVYGWLQKPGQVIDTSRQPEFVYCPSEQHAVATSILRAASRSNNPAIERKAFQLNLSSSQVRKGLWFLEGIRKNYSSEEILGHMLEKMIRNEALKPGATLTPRHIYQLRKKYPLKIETTEDSTEDHPENFTIVDGERFIRDNTDPIFNSLRAELVKVKDAAADITLGEIIFQEGNTERQGAWMDFLDGKVIPPEPEFVRTKRTGTPIGTQIFLCLPLPEPLEPPGTVFNPRIIAEPVFAAFCQQTLQHHPDKVIKVRFSRVDGASGEVSITTTSLDVEAVDLVVGGKEELLTRLRYYILKQWRSTNPEDDRSPYHVLGNIPEFDIKRDPLTELKIELVPASNEEYDQSIHSILATALSVKTLFARNPENSSVNINPMDAPLPFDVNRQLDLNASVSILENRAKRLRRNYLDESLAGLGAVVGLQNRRSFKNGLVKMRGLLNSFKTIDENSLTEARKTVRRVWQRLLLANPDITTHSAAQRIPEKISTIQNGTNEDALSVVDSLTTMLFELDNLYEEKLNNEVTEAIDLIRPRLNVLSTMGITKARLSLPATFTKEEAMAICEHLLNIVEETFEKLSPLMSTHASLETCVNSLLLSTQKWEEITSVIDTLDAADPEWRVMATDKFNSQIGFKEAETAYLIPILKDADCDHTRFLQHQLTAIRALDLTTIRYGNAGGGPENKITELIQLLQAATDKNALPVFKPFKLYPQAGSSSWRVILPEPSVNGLEKFAQYRKVFPRVDLLMDILPSLPLYRLYEKQSIDNPDSEEAKVSSRTDYFIGPAKDNTVSYPVFMKLESWQEMIPNETEKTAISLHYESPKTESPNAILVAVPPKIDGLLPWKDSHLADAIAETIQLMQIRMVTSDQVTENYYLGNYLPASIFFTAEEFLPPLLKLTIKGIAGQFTMTPATSLTPEQLQTINTDHSSSNIPPN